MKGMGDAGSRRPVLMVLASTYPRWEGDPEPAFVHELSRRLVDDFKVIVLCPHAPGSLRRETLDGVEVVRYRYAPSCWETLVNDGGIVANLRRSRWKVLLVPGFVAAQAWQAWRLSRKERIDVIHAHWLVPQGVIAAALQLLPGKAPPFVATSHGADLYALRGRLFDACKRFVLRRAAAVTVVSNSMLEEVRRLSVNSPPVFVQPMGVDLAERFRPGTVGMRSSSEILFVGRLVEKKGLRHLLDAMPDVLRRAPDALLSIAGFGPERDALQAQAEALGIGDAVRFLGAVGQADLPSLYRRAALFVAPFVRAASGDQEGLGLVVVEALGCGCPVLVGNVPAVADILGPAVDALAVDPSDTVALADRIVSALSDPVAARADAEQLRRATVGQFGWDGVAAAYSRVLADAMASPSIRRETQ